MTQEEKQLLLQDLCARLPYGIIFQSRHNENGVEGEGTFDFRVDNGFTLGKLKHTCELDNCKPYLRPMSSMTEEEREEYEMLQTYPGFKTNHTNLTDMYDWLNAHHFDYRGLIKKGLALEVTKDNNPYEN